MNFDQKELAQLKEAFNATFSDDVPRADCPPSGKIMDGVRDELPRGELKDLIRHIAVCPVCTETWQLAKKLESGSAPRRGWLKAASAIAAAALLLLVGYQSWLPKTGPRSDETLQLQLLNLPTLPRNAFLLRWTEFQGATFDVEVSTEDFSVKSRATGIGRPEHLVPEAQLEGVPGGAVLLVHVVAHLPEHGRIADTFEVGLR